MKDKLKLIGVALGIFLLILLFSSSISYLFVSVSENVVSPYLEESAKCKSLGGEYGKSKCFVGGKEIKLREQQ